MPYDIVIVGGGPAGLSAAVNAAARGKTCAVLTNDRRLNPLFRARVVDNYLGMRGLSGGEMLDRMHAEAEEAGAVFLSGRVVSVLPFEDKFLVGLGDTLVEGKRVILATGAMAGTPLPGEAALVGQGVSYCATCDGMLYRGKTAVVTGNAADLREEANFLQGIGVRVTVITRQELDGLAPGIGQRTARSMAIQGDGRLEGFVADGEQIPCDVVFVLREVMAPDALVPGLELDGRFVKVNRRQETNIPGLYAAGDCTGKPLQIAKAVGRGTHSRPRGGQRVKRRGGILRAASTRRHLKARICAGAFSAILRCPHSKSDSFSQSSALSGEKIPARLSHVLADAGY